MYPVFIMWLSVYVRHRVKIIIKNGETKGNQSITENRDNIFNNFIFLDLFKVSMDIYRYAAYLNMFLTVLKLQHRYDKNANDKIVINDIIVFNKSIEIILVTCLTLSNVNIM